MDFETQLKLYRSWGYRLCEIDGLCFRKEGLKISSFPPEKIIEPDRGLIRKLRRTNLVSSLLMQTSRSDMYEYILETAGYSIETFNKKTRYSIRKSLKNCTFRRPTLEELIEEGLRINRATLHRQKKKDKLLSDRNLWTRYITSVFRNPEFRIMGAFCDNRMAGLLIMFEAEGWYKILEAYIDRQDASRTQPMTGLLYTMINELLEEKASVRISYGMHQFAGKSPLNHFKKNLHFMPRPATRGYVLHPIVAIPVCIAIWYWFRFRKFKKPRTPFQREILRIYQGYRQVRLILKAEGKASKNKGRMKDTLDKAASILL